MPPIPPRLSPYKQHIQDWKDCTNCPLCETRSKVVFVRGNIPCDILFIGEAPGLSEDVLGKPFVGPAGKLLDHIISRSIPSSMKLCFTNLIGCIPLGDDGEKTAEPSDESIEACRPKLMDIIRITKPSGIVCVGKLSTDNLHFEGCEELMNGIVKIISITHPARILRSDISNRGLLTQRCEVDLQDLALDVDIPF